MIVLIKMILPVILLGTGFLTSMPIVADDGVVTVEPPEQFIVHATSAAVMHGSERVNTVALGTLFEATLQRGPWRYSKAINGWVHMRDLVPLDGAVDEFSSRIEQEPTAETYHLRGIAYMAAEDWGRAVNDLEKAYDLGESSASLHLNLGQSLIGLGLREKALEEYSSVLKTYPDEVVALLARGNLFLDIENFSAAIRDFEKVISLQEGNAEAYNGKGVALSLQNQYDEAVIAFNGAINADPHFLEAVLNRAYALKSLEQFDLAQKDYELALTVDNESAAAQNDFAWMLATCSDSNFRKPKRAIELALAANRSTEYRDPGFIDTLAAAYAADGQFEKAIQTCETAIELVEDEEELEELKTRIQSYRESQPYIESVDEPSLPEDSEEAVDSSSTE
ncbi:tetratricopeptide repeat protein [Thalassoglobus sp. JC818]|uniref:tetratricopeptide repeat protein n=1 Tax=Thalassoglobus sp. JC818 TaxID=3232136 RepID=UPI00345932BB